MYTHTHTHSPPPPSPVFQFSHIPSPILLHNLALLELDSDAITEGLTKPSVDLTLTNSWQSGVCLCLCLCVVSACIMLSVFISEIIKSFHPSAQPVIWLLAKQLPRSVTTLWWKRHYLYHGLFWNFFVLEGNILEPSPHLVASHQCPKSTDFDSTCC